MAQAVRKARPWLIFAGVVALAASPSRPALAEPAEAASAEAAPRGAAPAAPAPAGAAPVGAAPAEFVVRASLAIDTNEAGPSGPIIHERLDELGNRQLRRAEVLPGRGTKDPWIQLTVKALPGDEPGYKIASGLFVDGQAIAGSLNETECRLCTEGEAVERGTSEVERLVPFIRDHARTRYEAQLRAAQPPPQVDEPPKPAPLGAKGKAGVGLLAGGAVALGVGIGLALRPDTPDPNMPLNDISTKPAGGAVIGVGAAALVTGAILLALDRTAPKRRTAWLPAFGRGSAGFVISGSF